MGVVLYLMESKGGNHKAGHTPVIQHIHLTEGRVRASSLPLALQPWEEGGHPSSTPQNHPRRLCAPAS